MKKYLAEMFGTAMLVLIGCGSVVLAGFPGTPAGFLQIALAFGLTVTVMAYTIGPISGCHINPAVSLGAAVAGRLSWSDFVWYSVSQCIGALVGAGLLLMIAQGKLSGFDLAKAGLGANGFGKGYLGEFGQTSALLVEFITSFIFVGLILQVTSKAGAGKFAGLIIGLTLALIHLVFINVTGTSVNPARSLGPALLVGGTALSQVWVFIAAPLAGAALAGIIYNDNVNN